MTAAHTSGPWELFMDRCANGDMALAIKSTKTGACVGFPAGATDQEIAANGEIQAMALLMLEACRFMFEHAFERKWDGDEKAYSMLAKIVGHRRRTAIAQAQGEQT